MLELEICLQLLIVLERAWYTHTFKMEIRVDYEREDRKVLKPRAHRHKLA